MIITETKNLEAERCLLGCVMLNCAIMDRLLPVLRVDTFTAMSRKRIWQTMLTLYKANQFISLCSVRGWIGTKDYDKELLMCVHSVPTSQHWDHYLAIVVEKHTNRIESKP